MNADLQEKVAQAVYKQLRGFGYPITLEEARDEVQRAIAGEDPKLPIYRMFVEDILAKFK